MTQCIGNTLVFKLVKDSHSGWNKRNWDGADHAIYTLVVHLIVSGITYSITRNYQAVEIASWITQGVMFACWMYIEYKQEKAMLHKRVDQQSHLKFWNWSINRKQDVGLPFLASSGFNIGLQMLRMFIF